MTAKKIELYIACRDNKERKKEKRSVKEISEKQCLPGMTAKKKNWLPSESKSILEKLNTSIV